MLKTSRADVPETAMGPLPTGSTGDPLALLSTAQAAVLDRLSATSADSTVADLADALGQHPNTVRAHLDALVESGLVSCGTAPAVGRGRPAIRYRALPLEQTRPAVREYANLAAALAGQIARSSADPGKDALEAGIAWGTNLATARTPSGEQPSSRRGPAARHQVVEIMDDLGFAPESDPAATVVRLRRCPLLEAAHRHPEVVCGVHLGLVRGALEVLGGDPERSALAPFAEPGACRLDLLTRRPAGANATAVTPAATKATAATPAAPKAPSAALSAGRRSRP